MTRTATRITQIATVAVPATDQERSLAFYTDVLGFEKTRDAPFGSGQRWIEVTPPAGGTTIAIPPLGKATGVHGNIHKVPAKRFRPLGLDLICPG